MFHRLAARSLRSASASASNSSSKCHKVNFQSKRFLNLHEYQSSAIMEQAGVNVPFGIAAHSVEEAVAAANQIGDEEVVIKSQILAGG
ncbi:unnamed protein product, partial [Cylindrotheca closterium]